MIRSALELLQAIGNKQRPLLSVSREDTPTPVLSGAVTSALTAWISRQNSTISSGNTPLVSPPPSTPLEASLDLACRPISASELIAALSALIPAAACDSKLHRDREAEVGRWREEKVEDGEEGQRSWGSSDPCSVPSTTPQEGLSEWLRLGIRPEEVIQALSALTIQEPPEESKREEDQQPSVLSPISEEHGAGTGSADASQMEAKLTVKRKEGENDYRGIVVCEFFLSLSPSPSLQGTYLYIVYLCTRLQKLDGQTGSAPSEKL